MMNGKKNVVVEKSFAFSLSIITLYKELIKANEYVLSKQLLRSATAIGANVEEAQAGQSRKDFLAKMYIATKEAREAKYWLRLLNESKLVDADYQSYIADADELIALLTSITKTIQVSQSSNS